MPASTTGTTNGTRWIRPEKRLAIYLRDQFRCLYCHEALHGEGADQLSLDHLVPRVWGGSNDPINLVTACVSCNSSRKDRSWRKFATDKGPGVVLRILRHTRRKLNLALARTLRDEGVDAYTYSVETR